MGKLRIEIEVTPVLEQKKDLARIFALCAETQDLDEISTWINQRPAPFSITVYHGGSHLALHRNPMKPPRLAIITAEGGE